MTRPAALVLTDPLPAGWCRCERLGCGAPGGHAPPHVPETVPSPPEDTARAGVAALGELVAVEGPEVDLGAELRADPAPAPGHDHAAFIRQTAAEVATWPAWKRSDAALGLRPREPVPAPAEASSPTGRKV